MFPLRRVAAVFGIATLTAEAAPIPFTLIHTTDLHSNFTGSGPSVAFTATPSDGDPIRGHYARLAWQIEQVRRERAGIPVLTLDTGDFFSGTLFQALAVSPRSPRVPELEFFAQMNYDAITLGNHEFDAYDDGVARMLRKARPLDLPIVVSNLRIEQPETPLGRVLTEMAQPKATGLRLLPELVRDLRTADGARLRIGILGLHGPGAAMLSGLNRKAVSFTGFDDAGRTTRWSEFTALVRAQVAELREQRGVAVVIALFHGGEPEDRKLAAAVPGLDVILASHTHESYVRTERNTLIEQPAALGEALGVLDLEHDPDTGRTGVRKVHQLPIDDRVPIHPQTDTFVRGLAGELGSSMPGLAPDQVLFSFARPHAREGDLGCLVTSAIRRGLNLAGEQVDLYVTPSPMLRSDIHVTGSSPTPYTLADLFRIVGFAFEEGSPAPGLGVVDFHFPRERLPWLVELGDLLRLASPRLKLEFSDSLTYERRSWGVPFFGRVHALRLNGTPLADLPPLVRVAVNTEFATHILRLPRRILHWLRLEPLDAQGRPLQDFTGRRRGKEYELFIKGLTAQGYVEP